MNPLPLLGVAVLASSLALSAADTTLHSFQKQQLERHYWSEGANFGDLNKDGQPDAVSGPYWWEGPGFTKRHEIYAPTKTTKTKNQAGKEVEFPGFEGAFGGKNAYSTDNFFAFIHDLNGDGWSDVLTYGLPNTPAFLYLNPKGKAQHWERHTVLDHVDNESPTFTDITGDGKPEIVCNYEGNFGYASPDWSNPTAKWKFTPITENGKWARFTHGLGVGDVNGDGKMDLLFKDGWFEQPASLTGNPVWKLHKVYFAPTAAQMYAYDVNGDGRADVVTALAAHGYGLAWHEQLAEKDDAGSPKWRSHVFMHKQPEENRYGVRFPELHAVELFDVDGDGLKDIITGNCYWAHGPAVAPGPGEEGVLYWFKLVRNADKSVDWVPHLIDDNSGVGRQIGTADVNGDGRQDLVIGNKLGTFVFTHQSKKVSEADWQKAQPVVKFASAKDQNLEKMTVVVHTVRPNGTGAAVKGPTSAVTPKAAMAKGGVLPMGANGKPLNLDFETGTLQDWKPEGKAWEGQPVKGEIDPKRPSGEGKVALPEGNYWLGGYEVQRDTPTGTLTSAPFKVTHPWAAFRIGGGSHKETRVEIVRSGSNRIILTAHGRNSETMLPLVVDLKEHLEREIFIRIVDEHTGGWGHVNFDDFKFYPEKPQFAGAVAQAVGRPVTAAAAKPELPPDAVKFEGLSPEDAAKEMTLPPGFKAYAFAGEPDVKQPIAFTIDDKGRLWVVENYTYPHRQPEGKGTDRILVLEDTDGDHKFDRRTVFYEGLNMASGIEYGFGGVFVGAPPWLLHIPMKEENGIPKAAGEPKILLEGFAWHDTHEMLNSFQWGPDGWLYGCHGVFTHSHVKRPDQPDSERQFINAGVWRYHPVKKDFEVFAEGTSNPWGLDFNEYGHAFIEACVIPHFFHIIQGARYQRQAGQHYAPTIAETLRVAPQYYTQSFATQKDQPDNPYTFKDAKIQPINPFIYDDIKHHGDHVHYLGDRPHAGNNRSDAVGGGHAHAGLMVYLGGSWPEQYHGKVFMNNIHGQRINMDIPERTGSGYVGKHGPDFVNFNDRWSQIINLRYDHDGSVYLIDWYDKQQCHNQRDPQVHDRSNGRIFKIVFNEQGGVNLNLASLKDMELAAFLASKQELRARATQRLLQERAAQRSLDNTALAILKRGMADGGSSVPETKASRKLASEEVRLRHIWAVHSTVGLSPSEAASLLRDKSDYVRSWIIQLLCEDKNPSDDVLKEFARMAKEDKSPMVRLYLASAMQRTPVEKRLPVLEALLARAEDAADHNLPLMYWYAAEPVVGASTQNAVKLLAATKTPKIREFITRRMTAKPVARVEQ